MIDRVSPGTPLGSSPLRKASVVNNVLDAADDYLRRAIGRPAGGIGLDNPGPGVVRVKNTSGSTIQRFGILGIGSNAAPIITPTANLLEFQNRPIFAGETPSATDDVGQFVVALKPIPAGRFGLAIASGIAVVQVNVLHDKHLFADVKNADATQLNTSHSGAAQILYRQAGTSGTKWALVRIGSYGPVFLIGKASGAITKGTSGTVAVWIGPSGSEVDSTLTVPAFNLFADVADGKWVGCSWNGFGWYLTAAEC